MANRPLAFHQLYPPFLYLLFPFVPCARSSSLRLQVSRGMRQRKTGREMQQRDLNPPISPAEATDSLDALTAACAALRWNMQCDSLRAELLALAKRGDEGVSMLMDVATRMRDVHMNGTMSSVQLSAVLGAYLRLCRSCCIFYAVSFQMRSEP